MYLPAAKHSTKATSTFRKRSPVLYLFLTTFMSFASSINSSFDLSQNIDVLDAAKDVIQKSKIFLSSGSQITTSKSKSVSKSLELVEKVFDDHICTLQSNLNKLTLNK